MVYVRVRQPGNNITYAGIHKRMRIRPNVTMTIAARPRRSRETQAYVYLVAIMSFLPRGLLVPTLLLIYAIGCMTENEDGNPFTTLMETLPPPAIKSSPPFSKSSAVFPILTRVLNAFPPTERDGSEVSVILEEDKVEGVRYGSVIEKQTMMHSMEDFVILFSNHTNEGKKN